MSVAKENLKDKTQWAIISTKPDLHSRVGTKPTEADQKAPHERLLMTEIFLKSTCPFFRTLEVGGWKPSTLNCLDSRSSAFTKTVQFTLELLELSRMFVFLQVLFKCLQKKHIFINFLTFLEGFLPYTLFLCWRQTKGRSKKSMPKRLFSKNDRSAFVEVSLGCCAHFLYWEIK